MINRTAGEPCDDGNTANEDGCASDCTLAPMPMPDAGALMAAGPR